MADVDAPLDNPVIRIHPADDVVIARRQLMSGTVLPDEGVTVSGMRVRSFARFRWMPGRRSSN